MLDREGGDEGERARSGILSAVAGEGGAGPLTRYLPYLTPVLAAVVAAVGWLHRARYGNGDEGWATALAAAGNLPVLVHGATVVAKLVMGSVEPGLGELEGLKYGYKGA